MRTPTDGERERSHNYRIEIEYCSVWYSICIRWTGLECGICISKSDIGILPFFSVRYVGMLG